MFVRLKGCNLNCSYCDTTWANKRNAKCELLTAPQIVERIKEAGVELVTLTGGEPLLDENVSELIGSILMMPKVEIEIETNGSVPIKYYKERDNRLTMTMDYKLPSSNMEESMCLENMEYLNHGMLSICYWKQGRFKQSKRNHRKIQPVPEGYHIFQSCIWQDRTRRNR